MHVLDPLPHFHFSVDLTLSMLYSKEQIPMQQPGPLTNFSPCQRQRGFKAAGFGSLYLLQAIFQPIHLAGIIECPCLSTPGGVTSYHKPQAPLLIKQGMGGRRWGWWKDRRMEGERGRGEMVACYFDRHITKLKLIMISSRLLSCQEFSFNVFRSGFLGG